VLVSAIFRYFGYLAISSTDKIAPGFPSLNSSTLARNSAMFEADSPASNDLLSKSLSGGCVQVLHFILLGPIGV
jgi:hypothetical protein